MICIKMFKLSVIYQDILHKIILTLHYNVSLNLIVPFSLIAATSPYFDFWNEGYE